jgi:hypothetical protein
MKLYALCLVALAILVTPGCQNMRSTPTTTSSTLIQPTIPPVSQEERYRLDFYAAFEQGGTTGLGWYFASFSWTDDTERKAVCKAVHDGGWEYATTHLSKARLTEFKGILATAGYTNEFPTGDQLFKVGKDAYQK